MKFPHDLEVVPIPKSMPSFEPMDLELMEKSRRIVAGRFLNGNDIVEVSLKLRNGQIKIYRKEQE